MCQISARAGKFLREGAMDREDTQTKMNREARN